MYLLKRLKRIIQFNTVYDDKSVAPLLELIYLKHLIFEALWAQLNPERFKLKARSSVVEHHLDMVVVGGSIPLVPTII